MFAYALVALIAVTPGEAIDDATEALAEFRPADAVQILEGLEGKGPLVHADHVMLYEQLGIAYAYLDRPDDAVAAFLKMLALDPSRAISYTLSPKVTFLFEKARRGSAERAAPAVDVSWPRDLFVDRPVPVDVEVVADPERFLDGASLFFRRRGEPSFRTLPVRLPKKGERPARVEIPAPAPEATASDVLELYLVARDGRENEVLVFGGPERPRELNLAYEPPDPWYGKWWFWAAAGTVVAATAGAAVFAVTREPGPTVDGTFEVMR